MYKLIDQYKILHKNNPQYGTTSVRHIDDIISMLSELNISSILDYGCGKGELLDLIELQNVNKYKYDPAILKYNKIYADKVDVILNIDVLEHIPKDELDYILNHIKKYSNNVIFLICLIPAGHKLPNGMNCHVTVEKPDWWLKFISKYFPKANIYNYPSDGKKVFIKTW